MKFGIIKERKTPPDRRVVFTPEELKRLKAEHSEAEIKVETSDIRVYDDSQYIDAGIEVADDMTDCDVLFGVKEVPIAALITNKKYFSICLIKSAFVCTIGTCCKKWFCLKL